MNDAAFNRLNKMLTEMQLELGGRYWDNNKPFELIVRADKFRGDLWDAICAYRDAYSPMPKLD